jgi:hypothetical protein
MKGRFHNSLFAHLQIRKNYAVPKGWSSTEKRNTEPENAKEYVVLS